MEHRNICTQTDQLPKEPETPWELFFSHADQDMKFCFDSITCNDAAEYIYFGDLQKDLFYISDNMRDTFGFYSNLVVDLLGAWGSRIHGEKMRLRYRRDIQALFEQRKEVHDLRYEVEDKDGRVFWVRCCGFLKWNEDRTRALSFAGRIVKQDDYFVIDPVSNFLSDVTFRYHVADGLAQCREQTAIGFCDNYIAHINKMYGPQAADQIIARIGQRLMDELSYSLTFYRLPGLRCVALTDRCGPEELKNHIRDIWNIVAEEYGKLGEVKGSPCSFVVMELPQLSRSPREIQEDLVALLKLSRGSDQETYLSYTADNIEKVRQRQELEMALTQDVVQGMKNFRMVIQPLVNAATGEIIGGETLMRWRYQGQDISPGIFIPILEKNDMISTAGTWIFEQAVITCKQLTALRPNFYLTVNVSMPQLDSDIIHRFPRILDRHHLSGRHIVVEMTESCMDTQPAKLSQMMELFQDLGIRFALDDFGTGYSSLRVLMRYPTQIIKLDRSLLLEMQESEQKSEFINGIVYACHQFGKKVCMEGVETPQQLELAHRVRCDIIQGFYYYRPTELDRFCALLADPSL